MFRLRTVLITGIVLLVAAIVASVIYAVSVSVDRAERANVNRALARGRNALAELLEYRRANVKSDCHLVANEPLLRAAVGTEDTSPATIADAIRELKKSLAADLLLVADEEAALVGEAGSVDPATLGSVTGVLDAARKTGDGGGVWLVGNLPHQVHACKIAFGDQVIGFAIVGRSVGGPVAATIYRQTGATVVITLDGKRVAASPMHDDAPSEDVALDGIAERVGQGPTEVTIGAVRYVGVGLAFPDYDGKRALAFTLVSSLDAALAPGKRLVESIIVIAGVALVFALLLAFLVASRLSRPVSRLVEFTHQVGKGELATRATPSGPQETRKLANAMNQMVQELEANRKSIARKERLEREMEIAQKIQLSILPRNYDVRGLEIAAQMIPADEVGGDYYDVLPTDDGCWIGIGDVAGHGLTAGLEMLMVQSVVSGLVRRDPKGSPRDIVTIANRVIYENIRYRMRKDEFVTFTLFRYQSGRLVFAGAHEDIVVLRAATGVCECIETPGTWLGGIPDVSPHTHDRVIELAPGDVLLLYTDGITEARDANNEQFGMERMTALLERDRFAPVEQIRDQLLEAVQAWQARRDDDLSVVVVRVVDVT